MIDVLVIDDDPVYGELTLERLEEAGHHAMFFLGPFGTMNRIRQVQPKLVILDVNMPALAGTNICELIRSTKGLSEMRVLLHSSLDPRELNQLMETHRADAALHKSATASEFLSLVTRLLRGASRPSLHRME